MVLRFGQNHGIKRCLVGLVVLGTFQSVSEAQTAKDILPHLQKRRERIRTLHQKTTTTVKDRSGALVRTVTVETWEHRQDDTRQFRTQTKTVAGEKADRSRGPSQSLTVGDGKHTWREVHRGDTVLVIKSRTEPESVDLAGLIKAGRAKIVKEEKVGDESCYLIETVNESPGGKSSSQYWISGAYGLILKSAVHQRDGSVAVTVTDELQVNEPLSGVTFSYEPPEGARVLDTNALGGGGD